MVLSEWLHCWVLQSYRAGSASVPTLAPLAHNYERPKFCLSLVFVSLCHTTISSMLVLSVLALKVVDNRRERYQWTTTPHHRLRPPPLQPPECHHCTSSPCSDPHLSIQSWLMLYSLYWCLCQRLWRSLSLLSLDCCNSTSKLSVSFFETIHWI